MSFNSFLIYLILGWQLLTYAQVKAPQTAAHITFGSGPACEVSADVCSMDTANKAPKDTQLSYQPKTRELLIRLDKQKLGKGNTDKLLSEQRHKGKMQYRFTYDNPLPPDVVQQLGLKGKVYIKKGVYPIIVTKEAYLLRVTLVFK